MKIAGRKSEIQILQQILHNQTSSFLAVYGRRRIGKTYLIRHVYSNQMVFECSGWHERSFAQQLENFKITLQETSGKEIPSPQSWIQAFALLKRYISGMRGKKKKVIFLDEIAWFDTPRSGFLAALDHFWNQFCAKRNDIVLVICGSAASWILKKITNNRGGLHNRITHYIQLLPFTLAETRAFLEMQGVRLGLKDITLLYMCTGGIPFYLKDLRAGRSVAQLLNDLYMGPQAILKNEFRNLYASLFRNYPLHEQVTRELARKNKGLSRSEIIKATGLSTGGGLSLVMNELVACGFVIQMSDYRKSKEGNIYRLVDEYSLFYYKFLSSGKVPADWKQLTVKQNFRSWSGYAFETLCTKHIHQIKKALGIHGIVSQEYAWSVTGTASKQGAQIDLVIDRADNCINLLEMKFYDAKFETGKHYAEQLRQKADIFRKNTKTRKNIFFTLVSIYGAQVNEHYLNIFSQEILVDDLFSN